jgi:predicted nucleic acid-binding protein
LGELEAITLYKELDADLLLIDDNRAKKYAILNDINVIGSLGVLIKGKEHGHLPHIKPLLETIQKSEIYISDVLIDKVLEICDE